MFEALVEIVERDVAEANKLPADRRAGCRFDVEQNGDGLNVRLLVRRHAEGDDSVSVVFEKKPVAIRVVIGPDVIVAAPQWNDQALRCRLNVKRMRRRVEDGLAEADLGEREVWELSQLALGPLFFQA